jgi:mRNA-decapping enzyme 1B
MGHDSGRAKVTPNPAINGEGMQTLNLTVLQHLDPIIEDLLITSSTSTNEN